MPRRKHAVLVRDDRAALQPGSAWWAYCRVSLGEKQDLGSQRRAVQEFADKHQLVISRWWVDDHVSGSSVEGRNAFDQMIELSKQDGKGIAGVLVWNMSRWARNDLESQYFRADLRLRGYAVVSVADDIPGGDLALIMESLLDYKNRKYLEDLSKDTRRGLREAVLREMEVDGVKRTGFSGGGFPPRGYRTHKVVTGHRKDGSPRVNALWELDPEWQERVVKARQMFARGEKLSVIHTECKLFRHLSSYATFWSCETYAGIRRCGDVTVLGAHSAYDDVEQRAAILARLQQSASRHNPRPHSRKAHMLSGLLFCGDCGSPLHGNGRPRGGPFYYCPKARRKDSECQAQSIICEILDATVIEALRDWVFTEKTIQGIVDVLNEDSGQDKSEEQERQRIEREQRKLSREIKNLVELAASGAAPKLIVAAIRPKEQQQAANNAKLQALSQPRRERLQFTSEQIRQVVAELQEKLAGPDRETVWALVRSYVKKVTLFEDRAEITPTIPVENVWTVRYPRREGLLSTLIVPLTHRRILRRVRISATA